MDHFKEKLRLFVLSCQIYGSFFFPFRDAQDAIRGRDGYDLDGKQLRVELPRSAGGGGGGGGSGGGGGGFRGRDREGGYGGGSQRNRRFIPRGNGFRVLVKNLPPTGSWQDLKDHMREAGDVMFTDVFGDCTGVVEFARFEDMKRAVKILNDTKFRSHQVCILMKCIFLNTLPIMVLSLIITFV